MSAYWIIDQLIAQGVDHFCLSPGSRSTPLAIAIAEHPLAKSMVHFDERGVGFYALGFGKGAQRAAAVITTSGTAVGNLLPSIMEAHHSHTPMILLTADRPPHLHDCGANQTTEQTQIFGNFVRWKTDFPVQGEEKYFRSTIAQAVSMAHSGPVHLNCRFEEPFFPLLKSRGTPISHFLPRLLPDPRCLKQSASRGLIWIGQIPIDPQPILKLAQRLQWPVFSDILSQGRLFPTSEQIRGYDQILKEGCDLSPDLILHFGERLISKNCLNWRPEIPLIHISSFPTLQDPERRIQAKIQCDMEIFCEQFEANTDSDWLPSWKKLEVSIPSHPLSIPPGFALFLGNSMPIREADQFLYPENCEGFYCNRGLSGIDGNIATAAGLAEGLQKPVIALIGDQACLHDLNSIPLLKKSGPPLHLIVENNYGGQIFTRLPVAASPYLSQYWTASHNWSFEGIAHMFELDYLLSENLPSSFSHKNSLIEWRPSSKKISVPI